MTAVLLVNIFGSVSAILAADRKRLIRAGCDDRAAASVVEFATLMRALLRADVSIMPVISSSASLRRYLSFDMAGDRSERVRILFLDVRSGLIADETLFLGTLGSTTFSPREVVHRALDLNASSFIIVHNHPSGDPSPSRQDIRRTHEIADAAALFGIELVDHIVVATSGVESILRPVRE